ncbi:MAG: S1 RNA-binding domain-containing protein [Candidatus Bilamarchaeaceae archaeon]
MAFPEQDELVVIKIKKIMPYGAFCILEEYPGLEGFLHVSEVAARWIKNIHEFISEGKTYVAKVHRLDREKNQIDVSLRRVSEEEKKRKLESVTIEKKTAKLLELAIKNSGVKMEPKELREKIESEYDYAYDLFEEIANEQSEKPLAAFDFPDKLKKEIYELAIRSVKKSKVEITRVVDFSSTDVDGVGMIRSAFDPKRVGDKVRITYLGAPRYKMDLEAEEYKGGEKEMGKILAEIERFASKNKCLFSVEEAE